MNITLHQDNDLQIIAMRESAQRQLAQIKTIDAGVDYLSKVKALEAYARATKQDAEIVLMVQEQKLRSMRILGKLLGEMELNEGGNVETLKQNADRSEIVTGRGDTRPRLSDLGISKNESSAYQKIAGIPDEVFEREIEAAKSQDEAISEITVAHILRVAQSLTKPHIANNSGNNEWYTPGQYIELARTVLERIDLDPASNEQAQQVVKASTYYTIETDGLSEKWQGRTWMNPPYGAGDIEPFCEKLIKHFLARDIDEAIVLVNNATETRWFQDMAKHAEAICFPKGRIRYWGPDGDNNSPLQGQAFLYFGSRASRFFFHFSNIGLCVTIA